MAVTQTTKTKFRKPNIKEKQNEFRQND